MLNAEAAVPPAPYTANEMATPPANSPAGSPSPSPPPEDLEVFLGLFDEISLMYVPRTAVAMIRACVRKGMYVEVREVQGEEKVIVIISEREEIWKDFSSVCEIIVLPSQSLARRIVALGCQFPAAVTAVILAIAMVLGAVIFRFYIAHDAYRESAQPFLL